MSRGLLISRNLPSNIKRIILQKQAELKIGCNCIISQETTIYKIIEEWEKIKKKA